MRKLSIHIFFCLVILAAACRNGDNLTVNHTDLLFERAAQNGKLANEGFSRCMNYVNAWLSLADSTTGLIPRNIIEKSGRDIWNAKDCAADNYPFMVLTCSMLDREKFEGTMLRMLETETRITSRIGSLPDTYSFSKKGFARKNANLTDIIFGSSEYVKDGLIPLTEWLGPSPWSERMIAITTDEWKYAPVKTRSGNIISDDPEVNGDMLQTLSRLYWFTGDRSFLDRAILLGDHYLLGKNHPTRNFKILKLRDHGCEIVSGLCELYATVSFADTAKKKAYQAPVHEMLDRILETGRNSDGLFYNSINPVKGAPVNGGLADTYGYTLDGFYTVYMVDGTEKYREAVIKALSCLYDKYRSYPWEGPSADGYADAIESALNLYAREQVPSAGQWIDSEIKVMWNKQQQSGIIEGWHGDGNFARTTIMYCLWKTLGTRLMPWRKDLEAGALKVDSLIYLSVAAEDDWTGKLIFDRKRHKEIMHLPSDWPRINQFPEYYPVEKEKNYRIRKYAMKESVTLTGNDLLEGIPVSIKKGEHLKLIISEIK